MTACQAVAKDLLKELQVWKDTCFKEWTQLTMDKLGNIKVDKSGQLMDMNIQDGRIQLHYNDELVVLLREVQAQPSLAKSLSQDVNEQTI